MREVRFTRSARIVPTGSVHGREFQAGDVSSDPAVIEVALRNGWAEPVEAAVPAAPPAGPAPAAAAAPAEPPAPRPMKARRGPPENK